MASAARVAWHVLHVFPTFEVGGPQNRLVRVVNALQRKFRHTIISLDGNFKAAGNFSRNVDVGLEAVILKKTGFLNISNLRVARTSLAGLRPDLMLTYNWGATEWALANRIPVICPHIHFESGFGPDESAQRQHRRRVMARRLLLSRCKYIVVPSITLHDLATRLWRIASDRILYIPNGVDCGRFTPTPQTADLAALAIPEGAPVVGTVAALRREKNLLRLLRVFASLPRELGARLVVVGDGPEGPALKAAVEKADLTSRILFAGYRPDPSRLLGLFNVFALSSDTEQMPNSILEAMAAGLAVAATDVGDIKHMLSRENAPFVVPVDDEVGLAQALLLLMQDRALAARVGAANRERVRVQFSLDTMVERYDSLYSGH